jgi:hypothetical protein
MNTQEKNDKQVKVALPARHMPGIAVTTGVRGGMTIEESEAEGYCWKHENFGSGCVQCLAPFMIVHGDEWWPEPLEKLDQCASIPE